ncbi:MAG: glycosyltransferase [Luteitalea sp.]|nr:glycosyltransferase [Luteitalea sp.]
MPSLLLGCIAATHGLTSVTATAAPLRILMLAPEPFFEPRGTPFSEYHRIKALVEDGHQVDLVTYPFGGDVTLPNVRIVRCARPPFVHGVPVGPSVRKAILDVCLGVTAFRLALGSQHRYDAIHSHEEAGLLGVWLSRRLGIPHLYDMHSSLPQQLTNFHFSRSRLLRRTFEWMERTTIRESRVIITICQELQDQVRAMGAGERAVLIENVMGGDVDEVPGPGRERLRADWGLGAEQPVVLYTGTFESYQGLDLLLDAAVHLRKRVADAVVLIIGGTPDQVAAYRERAAQWGAPVVCVGQRPPEDIPHFVDACDALVSPRTAGTNTPLKIYSYLRSGRPIVATDLWTHRQVLDETSAVLVPAHAEGLAAGLALVLGNPHERARVVEGARALARSKYSREGYVERTRRAYQLLVNGSSHVTHNTPVPVAHVGARSSKLP